MSQNQSNSSCPRCAGPHPIDYCPQVKSIERDLHGNLAKIEFHEPPREKSLVEQMRERPPAASTLYTKDARGGM